MEGAEKEMELVIDTNKVIASIITSGKVRKIIVFSHLKFFAPKYMIFKLTNIKKQFAIDLRLTKIILNL